MAGQNEKSSGHHARYVQTRFQDLVDHLRGDIDKVEDPQAKAMFETAAEVLTGLKKAFSDYEHKNESAWRT